MNDLIHEASPEVTGVVPGRSAAASAGRLPATARLAPRAQVFVMRAPDGAPAAQVDAERAVERAAGSTGSPLDPTVRARFEASLGTDLSAVRVHTGPDSEAATRAVGAKAYTTGNDIHFAAGRFAPHDPFGVHLLAHEVAHTVQQRGATAARQAKLEISVPGDACEREADLAADAMVAGAPAQVSAMSPRLARLVLRSPDGGGSPWNEPPDTPEQYRTETGGAGGADGSGGAGGARGAEGSSGGAGGVPSAGGAGPEQRTAGDTGRESGGPGGTSTGPATPVQQGPDTDATLIAPFNWDAAAAGQSAPIDTTWGGAPRYQRVVHPSAAAAMEEFSDVWMQIRNSWNGVPPLAEPYEAAVAQAESVLPVGGIPKPLDPKSAGPKYAAVQAKMVELRSAGIACATKSRAIAVPMRDAQNALRSAMNETRNMQIAIEQAKIADGANQIAQVNNIKDGISKGLGACTSVGAALVDPTKAFDAIAKVGDFVSAAALNPQIHAITVTVSAAIAKIASLQVANAKANVESYMATAASRLDDALAANDAYSIAINDRQRIQFELAGLMQEAAQQSGRGGDAAAMRVALSAAPFVETVIAQNRAIVARIALPSYTTSSGIGATLCTNRDELVGKLSTLKGYRAKVDGDRGRWETTLTQIRTLLPSVPAGR